MKGLIITNWIIIGLAALDFISNPVDSNIYAWAFMIFLGFYNVKAWKQMKDLEAAKLQSLIN